MRYFITKIKAQTREIIQLFMYDSWEKPRLLIINFSIDYDYKKLISEIEINSIPSTAGNCSYTVLLHFRTPEMSQNCTLCAENAVRSTKDSISDVRTNISLVEQNI